MKLWNSKVLQIKILQVKVWVGLAVMLLLLVLWLPLLSLKDLLHGEVSQERFVGEAASTKVVVSKEHPYWIDYRDISKYLIYAIVSAEDSRFFQHPGVDIREMWQSFLLNVKKGEIVRGGSTITQQLVRLVSLSQEKTLSRKLREALGAMMLEGVLSKEEILCWYMNIVYFGSGVYGVQEASEYYFDRHPSSLSVSESIHLAMILPGPHKRSRELRERSLSSFGKRRFKRLLSEMYNSHYITTHQYYVALRSGNFGAPL